MKAAAIICSTQRISTPILSWMHPQHVSSRGIGFSSPDDMAARGLKLRLQPAAGNRGAPAGRPGTRCPPHGPAPACPRLRAPQKTWSPSCCAPLPHWLLVGGAHERGKSHEHGWLKSRAKWEGQS